jgi:hypothetical protein
MGGIWCTGYGLDTVDPTVPKWQTEHIFSAEKVEAMCQHIKLDVCVTYPLQIAFEIARGFLHHKDTGTAGALARAVARFPKLLESREFVQHFEDIIQLYISQNPDNTTALASRVEKFKLEPPRRPAMFPRAAPEMPAEHPPKENALKIVEALLLRAEKGRQEPEPGRSMAELVHELASLSWELWEKKYAEYDITKEGLIYSPATTEQIERFQEDVTGDLPADYIEFLKVTNG